MSELMVVPDSIDPVKGYKALNVNTNDGTLWSPSETVQWPVKQRLEAHCTRGLSQWSWVPIEGKPREMSATSWRHMASAPSPARKTPIARRRSASMRLHHRSGNGPGPMAALMFQLTTRSAAPTT